MAGDYGGNGGQAPPADKCASVISFVLPAANAWAAITGPSPKRRGIIISPPNSGVAFVANQAVVSGGNGFVLTPNSAPLYLCLYQHGDVVTKPWFVFCTTANNSVGFIEVMEP